MPSGRRWPTIGVAGATFVGSWTTGRHGGEESVERIGDTLSRLEMFQRISKVELDDSSSADTVEQPACSRCQDAGFLRADVPVGHADFGKVIACACLAV